MWHILLSVCWTITAEPAHTACDRYVVPVEFSELDRCIAETEKDSFRRFLAMILSRWGEHQGATARASVSCRWELDQA